MPEEKDKVSYLKKQKQKKNENMYRVILPKYRK